MAVAQRALPNPEIGLDWRTFREAETVTIEGDAISPSAMMHD